jgi:DNA-binding response OmpR family regulator
MSVSRPILIVEDDAALRATLAEQLAAGGEFIAEEADSAAAAEAMLADVHARYDAILLDVGLPDADGREFCAKLRRAGRKMPVIMLTGASDETDIVRGLDAGANDYVAKPFALAELVARVRAQLRSFDNSDDAVMVVGPYEFRPSAKLLMRTGTRDKIRLTNKEAAIIKFLHRAGGQAMPRAVLLDEVWGYNSGVTTHTLETHIYRLRQKIEATPSDPRLLVTTANGYMLALDAA